MLFYNARGPGYYQYIDANHTTLLEAQQVTDILKVQQLGIISRS